MADLHRLREPAAIALVGNAAEVLPRLVRDGVDRRRHRPDARPRHRGGLRPDRLRIDRGGASAEYRAAVERSLRAHGDALVALRDRGTIVFEYGNSLRSRAVGPGSARAAELPGFVAEYVRPILARGVGPYRWVCLSGDPADLRRSEDAVLEAVGTPGLEHWFELARARVTPQGLPARICWLGLGQRDAVGLRLNELVRRGEIGPLALGRDHMDPASVASPSRETEAMRDGSDAIADWPILGALLNAAQGHLGLGGQRRRRGRRAQHPQPAHRRRRRDRPGRAQDPARLLDGPGARGRALRRRGLSRGAGPGRRVRARHAR